MFELLSFIFLMQVADVSYPTGTEFTHLIEPISENEYRLSEYLTFRSQSDVVGLKHQLELKIHNKASNLCGGEDKFIYKELAFEESNSQTPSTDTDFEERYIKSLYVYIKCIRSPSE